MPLTVFSCCTYSTLRRRRTQEQWAALHFVKAIKGVPLKGYAYLPLPEGGRAYLDHDTNSLAASWFGRMAAARLTWNRIGRFSVVPVPDAACGVSAARSPKVLPLADALVRALAPDRATVLDVLRWVKPMPTAHQAGGTRDPQELYGRLRLTLPKPPLDDANVVLVDDVLASGGHLPSGSRLSERLWSQRHRRGLRRTRGRHDADDVEPFKIRTDVLPDFVSDPDWLLPMVVDGIDM